MKLLHVSFYLKYIELGKYILIFKEYFPIKSPITCYLFYKNPIIKCRYIDNKNNVRANEILGTFSKRKSWNL